MPYVTWQEQIDKQQVTFVGHVEGGAGAPVFELDTPAGIPASASGDVHNPVRAPISSGCTANPFSADGATCQGDAVGTPFLRPPTSPRRRSRCTARRTPGPSRGRTSSPSTVPLDILGRKGRSLRQVTLDRTVVEQRFKAQ